MSGMADHLEYFQRKFDEDNGGVVTVCNCIRTDPEWQGEHLKVVNIMDGIRICFYPDTITRQIVVLGLGEIELGSDVQL